MKIKLINIIKCEYTTIYEFELLLELSDNILRSNISYILTNKGILLTDNGIIIAKESYEYKQIAKLISL